MKNSLFLILTRKWFEAIASGRKKAEFRARTPHWQKRLANRQYDEVLFQLGYERDAPRMRVEFLGVDEQPVYVADPPYSRERKRTDLGLCFAVKLGRVLEMKNWHGPALTATTAPPLSASASTCPSTASA